MGSLNPKPYFPLGFPSLLPPVELYPILGRARAKEGAHGSGLSALDLICTDIYTPIIENQIEKKMDNEMETAIYRVM